MLWIVGMALLILLVVCGAAWAAAVVAKRADDEIEDWIAPPDEPRCAITGQPLTIRERFERECG